jgi:hypothetical protein
MTMYWIYDYPSWAIGLLFVAVFVGVTWIGIFVTRATVHSWVHREPRANDMVGLALSSFFVLFGLLLGLVAVATYQNFSSVSDTVDKEASSIAALYRDFGAYPQPIRSRLQDSLREYTRYTIEKDWSLQRRGIVPHGGTERMEELSELLFAFEPRTSSQAIMDTEALRQFNSVVELRRSRLANTTLGLPPVLWWVVAFGALLNIILIWLQDMEIHVHLILGGVLASILALVIFLIAALDNPFRGEVSIGPDSFTLVYRSFMKPGPSATQPEPK